MAKASKALLEELHGLLCNALTDELLKAKNGEDGIKASLFNVARQFLRDNNVVAGMGNASLADLEKAMEDLGDLPFDEQIPEEYREH
jgi:hypothetical protein